MALVLLMCAVVAFPGSAMAGAAQDLDAARHAELMGESDEARRLFDQAISSGELEGGALAEAYNARGDFFAVRGDTQAALADFEQALELDPDKAAYWYDRGVLRKESGDLQGALEDLTRAVDLDSSHALAHMERASCLQRLGDSGAAAQDRERLAELDQARQYRPGYSGPIETRTSWQVNEEYSQAVAHYNDAVRASPNDPGVYVDRGLALMNLGRLD
ncbi:MAG: tetratricopeptide repeat protein, partial [Desulfovibrio sp.]